MNFEKLDLESIRNFVIFNQLKKIKIYVNRFVNLLNNFVYKKDMI